MNNYIVINTNMSTKKKGNKKVLGFTELQRDKKKNNNIKNEVTKNYFSLCY